jgi:thiol-disulfide isomerase/thioredoxin
MRYLITALFSFSIITTFGAEQPVATIDIRLKNIKTGNMLITIPVQHKFSWAALKVEEIAANGLRKILINKSQTGNVNIMVFDKRTCNINLFVQEGDQLIVDVDTSNHENPVVISGKNPEGQRLFNSMPFDYARYVASNYKNDTTALLLRNHVADQKKEVLKRFEKLYEDKKINHEFIDFVKVHLDYYYATITSFVIKERYYYCLLAKDNPRYKRDFPMDFQVLWAETYKIYPLNNLSALQTQGYNDGFITYANTYVYYYLTFKKLEKGEDYKFGISYDEHFARIYNNFSKDGVAEYVAAENLFLELYQEKYQPELLVIAEDFKKRYPVSPFLEQIQPLADKIVAYSESERKEFSAKQNMVVKGDSINTFKELLETFKGKILFIDVWATWCAPCKKEFTYKDELKKFLKDHSIEILYISVDNSTRESMWKTMIKYYNLEGNHIRTNPLLYEEMENLLSEGSGSYGIPRYLLIDKEGKILEKNALPPSQGEKL